MNNNQREFIEKSAIASQCAQIIDENDRFEKGERVLSKLGIPDHFPVYRIHNGEDSWASLLIYISPKTYVHYYPHNDTYCLYHIDEMTSYTSWGDLCEYLHMKWEFSQSDVGL